MVSWRSLAAALCATAVALSSISCGGAGTLAEGGIGGSGISVGSVTGFGSVFVNGVEYETDGETQYAIDGVEWLGGSDRDRLAVGMVVRVEGPVDASGSSGRAERIVYDSSLRGPVTALDPTTSRFEVLGEVVHVAPTTQFGGHNAAGPVTAFAALSTGDRVEVSGLRGDGGELQATRVVVDGLWSDGGEVEVEGAVASVSGTTLFFSSGLEVDGSLTAPDFSPQPGQVIEAKGYFDGSRLVATELSLEDGLLEGEDGEHAEVEGIVTSLDGDRLVVSGISVRTTASTQTGGAVPGVGQRVEVEGELQGGLIVAESIEVHADSQFEFEGEVLSKDPQAGTIELFGQAIAVTAATIIGDKAAFMDEVQPGDFLSVHAAASADGLVATEIEFEESGAQEIAGPVSAIEATSLVVGGIRVDVSAVPAVLVGLSVGDAIEVTGYWSPSFGAFVATETEE